MKILKEIKNTFDRTLWKFISNAMDFYEQSFVENNFLLELLDKFSFVFSFTFILFSFVDVRKNTIYLIKNLKKNCLLLLQFNARKDRLSY